MFDTASFTFLFSKEKITTAAKNREVDAKEDADFVNKFIERTACF